MTVYGWVIEEEDRMTMTRRRTGCCCVLLSSRQNRFCRRRCKKWESKIM